jgi:glutamate dehydrogenase
VATGKPRSILSDEVGQTLMKLQDQLEASDLFENETARRTVLSQAIPKTLIKEIGLDVVLQRLPETYTRSLFASYLASRECSRWWCSNLNNIRPTDFIYKFGIKASFIDFYSFAQSILKEPAPSSGATK